MTSKRFTDEFKAEAVKQVSERGYPVAQVAERRVYSSCEEARSDLFDYIEIFYNRQRRHGHLGGLAPMMFEAANSKSSS